MASMLISFHASAKHSSSFVVHLTRTSVGAAGAVDDTGALPLRFALALGLGAATGSGVTSASAAAPSGCESSPASAFTKASSWVK